MTLHPRATTKASIDNSIPIIIIKKYYIHTYTSCIQNIRVEKSSEIIIAKYICIHIYLYRYFQRIKKQKIKRDFKEEETL